MSETMLLAHYNRYMWDSLGLLVIAGESSKLSRGRASYNARYGIKLAGPKHEAQLERLVAAAGLAALSLAERESWGWSMTLRGDTTGFFCGVEPEGLVCGQVHPAEDRIAKVAVQRKKANEPLRQSTYEPDSQDPVRAVQTYFEKVDQIDTRLAVTLAGHGVLVQALPGGRLDSLAALGDDQLVEHVLGKIEEGELKHLAEVLLFYECRCDDEVILNMLLSLPESSRAELWQGTDTLDIECPRCGREYAIARKTVEQP